MTFLTNLIQTIGIPYSALVSIVFGLMIVSFPIGAYVVFNSELGDDIDFGFPLGERKSGESKYEVQFSIGSLF